MAKNGAKGDPLGVRPRFQHYRDVVGPPPWWWRIVRRRSDWYTFKVKRER